jgi:hypothetical protein
MDERGDSAWTSRRRLAVAVAIGAASALFAGWCLSTARVPSDFEFFWRAARAVLGGADPYAFRPNTPDWPLPDPFFYPLPAIFPALPLAALSLPVAGAVFMGLSGALLAFGISREGPHRLWLFASGAYVMALKLGQVSPLLLAVAFVPALGFLLPFKPQIGVPVFLYRPSALAATLALAATAASFLVRPDWLAGWRANLRALEFHPAPILTWAGPALALGLLRWRRPEGRLFLAMIAVPQELFFADQLPLQLVARSRRQSAILAATSLAAFAGWYAFVKTGDLYVVEAKPWVLALLYGPALAVLLFGSTPAARN